MEDDKEKDDNIRPVRLEKGGLCGTFIALSSKPIKNFVRSTICIEEAGKVRKIISVSASKKDGSINVFFPYFSSNEAYIFQHKHIYGKTTVEKKQVTSEYVVDRTTKLSIHRSGFSQLSGNGILSGIDEITGRPRGIGVFSSPLDTPVWSGPTFSMVCWGIDHFAVLDKKENNQQYIILNKEKNNFTQRRLGDNKELNAYVFEFFIFPKKANDFVYEWEQDGNPYIEHTIHNYRPDPGATFSHPVLDIKNFDGVLAVFPVLMHRSVKNSATGYSIHSPGGSDCIHDKEKTGNNFHLLCPRNLAFGAGNRELENLEYK